MAQLKDTVVSGNLRVTDMMLTDTILTKIIKAPTSSGGTTYGPGTDGQVLKSNGSSVYWGTDNNSITGSGTSGYLTKWNGTNSITNGPQLGSSTTTFLRNDGSWATPVDTNYYHKTGTWSNLTYTAAKVGSPDDLAFTIPTGTTSTTVALGNHTHTLSIAADSGTSALTMAANTKYKLTAGGKEFIFTTPKDTTYSANNGVGLSGTTFYNSGVRSTTINGDSLRVNTNGTNADLTIPYATTTGMRWRATTKGLTWSRIYWAKGINPDSSTIIGSSGILSINCTRANVVIHATFLITTSLAGSNYGNCIQLSGANYKSTKVRIVVRNSDGGYYFEIYDNAESIASGTTQTWDCCFIPIAKTEVTTYDYFYDGSTVPSGYTALDTQTTSLGNAAISIKDASKSGTTTTFTKQNGSTFTVDRDIIHLGVLTTIGSASPASGAKTYFESSSVPIQRVSIGYNTSGNEYSLFFSKGNSATYGTVLRWGYASKYIEILRRNSTGWLANDWEKISAGYADTIAASANSDDGQHSVFFAALADHNTVQYDTTLSYNPSTQTLYSSNIIADTSVTLTYNAVADSDTPPLIFKRNASGSSHASWTVHGNTSGELVFTSKIGTTQVNQYTFTESGCPKGIVKTLWENSSGSTSVSVVIPTGCDALRVTIKSTTTANLLNTIICSLKTGQMNWGGFLQSDATVSQGMIVGKITPILLQRTGSDSNTVITLYYGKTYTFAPWGASSEGFVITDVEAIS